MKILLIIIILAMLNLAAAVSIGRMLRKIPKGVPNKSAIKQRATSVSAIQPRVAEPLILTHESARAVLPTLQTPLVKPAIFEMDKRFDFTPQIATFPKSKTEYRTAEESKINVALNDRSALPFKSFFKGVDSSLLHQLDIAKSLLLYLDSGEIGNAKSTLTSAVAVAKIFAGKSAIEPSVIENKMHDTVLVNVAPLDYTSTFIQNVNSLSPKSMKNAVKRASDYAFISTKALNRAGLNRPQSHINNFALDSVDRFRTAAFTPQYTFWLVADRNSRVEVYYAFTSDLLKRHEHSIYYNSNTVEPLRLGQLTPTNTQGSSKTFDLSITRQAEQLFEALFMIELYNLGHLEYNVFQKK